MIVKAPKKVIGSKDKLILSRFLRGLFDTDGCLSFRKCYGKYNQFKRDHHHYPSICFSTVSIDLSEDIAHMLRVLNFKFFQTSYQPKKINENKKFLTIINGVFQLEKWIKVVGIKNPVKLSRYQIWKKFGFCPTHTTLAQRKDILGGKTDPYSIYKSL